MTIFKMYDGRHIDLSKIVSVGPWFVGDELFEFSIWFQLMDAPLRFAPRSFSGPEVEEIERSKQKALDESRALGDSSVATERRIREAAHAARTEIDRLHAEEFLSGYASLMTAWGKHVDIAARRGPLTDIQKDAIEKYFDGLPYEYDRVSKKRI